MIGSEAQKPNPALEVLKVLIGEWKTTGTHPLVPGKTFHGHASFEWIEGGAFLLSRTDMDEPEIPSGVAIFGSDNQAHAYYLIYFDERGISRKYDVFIKDRIIETSRTTPEFSQKMTLTISSDGNTIESKGEMSREGGAWEGDLSLTYTRVK